MIANVLRLLDFKLLSGKLNYVLQIFEAPFYFEGVRLIKFFNQNLNFWQENV